MFGLHPQQTQGTDPGFSLAARGANWFDIDGQGYVYGRFILVNDAEAGQYEQFQALPEPDPVAGLGNIVYLLAHYGGMGAQYPAQYYSDPRYLQRMREVEQYLLFAERLLGRPYDWTNPIINAWRAQQAQFGAWSTFDDAGQTALKIIAHSGLPNARELSDAIRQTRNFQEGQAAMAQAWEESNKASNLFTTAKEIAQDVATLASSGGFRIIMLPFAVAGALNLANNLAQNGLTETIRSTAQRAADTLNNALSIAQNADAATVAAEQATIAAEQSAQAWPDVFAETDAGMAEALSNPTLPPELFSPPEPLNVFQETDAGMAEALESGGQLPADFVPATPYTPPPAPTPASTAPAVTSSALTQAAAAIKAGAGILAATMSAGGSGTARPGLPLQPGQANATGQPFTSAAFPWYILIPAAVLLLAKKG